MADAYVRSDQNLRWSHMLFVILGTLTMAVWN